MAIKVTITDDVNGTEHSFTEQSMGVTYPELINNFARLLVASGYSIDTEELIALEGHLNGE